MIEELNESNFEDYLYTKGLPPVDLLIRTSGEMRTSNFLPWQLAYAEFIFTPTPWPDFDKEQFRNALTEYAKRSVALEVCHMNKKNKLSQRNN